MGHCEAGRHDRQGEQGSHVGPDDVALDARHELDGVVGGAHRPERDGPGVADQDDCRGLDRLEAHEDEERRYDGDRHAEAGYALHEPGEGPAHDQGLRERAADEPRHGCADFPDAAHLVDQVVEQHGRPDDGQDEEAEAEPFGGRRCQQC